MTFKFQRGVGGKFLGVPKYAGGFMLAGSQDCCDCLPLEDLPESCCETTGEWSGAFDMGADSNGDGPLITQQAYSQQDYLDALMIVGSVGVTDVLEYFSGLGNLPPNCGYGSHYPNIDSTFPPAAPQLIATANNFPGAGSDEYLTMFCSALVTNITAYHASVEASLVLNGTNVVAGPTSTVTFSIQVNFTKIVEFNPVDQCIPAVSFEEGDATGLTHIEGGSVTNYVPGDPGWDELIATFVSFSIGP